MVNKNDDCSQGTDSDRCRMGLKDQLQGTREDETHLSFFFFFLLCVCVFWTVEHISTIICKLIGNVIP